MARGVEPDEKRKAVSTNKHDYMRERPEGEPRRAEVSIYISLRNA